MLRGAIAAALTPLRGGRLDEGAVAPYLEFLAAGGVDGALAMGTTGEGMLFDLEERKRIAGAFVAARGPLQLAVHAGMQATATTAALAEHAATIGADAVAVIPPPYFPLDDDALFAHLSRRCRCVCADAVLRLRVRAHRRVRRLARLCWTGCAMRAATSRG